MGAIRGQPIRWSVEQDAEIRRGIKAGAKVSETAARLGLSASTVRRRRDYLIEAMRTGSAVASFTVVANAVNRPPLPPFDPVSWDPIVAGTCLADLPRPVWVDTNARYDGDGL